MNFALNVNNLRKVYNNFILNGISFHVSPGSITGFIGKNGAGKSTTLKCILGLIVSYTGEIEILGECSKLHSQSINDRLGIVLDPVLFYENIQVKDMNYIMSKAYTQWNSKICYDYLEKFNISPNQLIGQLSSGMKKQLSIIYALSHNADLLILDEPTSGLDPYVRNQICSILNAYVSKKNKSVLFSTHIISDLEKSADQIIIINQGQIVYNNSKDHLVNDVTADSSKGKANLEECVLKYLE